MRKLKMLEGRQRSRIIRASIAFPYFFVSLLFVSTYIGLIDGEQFIGVAKDVSNLFLGSSIGVIMSFLFGSDDKVKDELNTSPKSS